MEQRRGREFEFELPVGYMDPDGRIQRAAVLRKMAGRDEAIMTDKTNRTNAARMVSELLGNCLLRLGDIQQPGTKVAQALYSADRHYLLMKLREITFGPEMQGTYSCPTCHEAMVFSEDLAELEVVRLSNGDAPSDIVVYLEDGYYDRSGEVYDSMVFRYPIGNDEEKVAPLIRENASLGKNALMARCLKALGDMPRNRVEALGTAIFNDLTLSDRAMIDRALNNDGPGLKMRRDITCSNCGRQFSASLDLSNFLALS
jgi:hypothetical protein